MNHRIILEKITLLATRILRIRFLYTLLIEPKSTQEDARRKEFVLNWILVGTLILLTLLGISIFISYLHPRGTYSGVSPLVFSLVYIGFAGVLLLSRKGYIKTSSILLISSYSLVTLYCITMWSIMLPMIILSSILIIIISSILFSIRTSIVLTIIVSLVAYGITWLQINAFIPINNYWRYDPLSGQDVIEIIAIFFCISGISWLANRETEKSLARARASEQALTEERNLLEIKVEERTRTIKELQISQANHLHHLADLGQLSAGIFHDLMSPLSGIVAHVDTLSKNHSEFLEMKPVLEKVITSSRRMNHHLSLVRKQLKPHDHEQVFSPADEIRDTIDILNYSARTRSVELCFTDLAPATFITGNSFAFHQIVVNLISNAIDAYAASTGNNNQVVINLNHDKDTIILHVSDLGCGIPPEHRQAIFTYAFTTKPTGNGIGLAHVKDIVENVFKGRISYTNNKPQGAIFSVSIPLSH